MVFDDLRSAFTNSRFALELALISDAAASKEMDLTKTASIDDEYTPGVFEVGVRVGVMSIVFLSL